MSSPSALFPSGSDEFGDEQPADAPHDASAHAAAAHDAADTPGPATVERVAEHPRKPGRYSLRLSGNVSLVVDADSLVAARAGRVGAELSAEQVALLQHAHRATYCVDRALGMLARARRSRRELAQRLRRVEPDAEIVERALDRLDALGLLDEAELARAETAARFRRGEGAGRIRAALRQKGIAREAIENALRTAQEDEQVSEPELCRAAAEKRMRALRSLEPMVQRRRLMAFLLRRGFPGSLVSKVVAEVMAAEH